MRASHILTAGCILLNISMTSCSGYAENSVVRKLPDGTWYMNDTPSLWSKFQRSMDFYIDDEVKGLNPSGGYSDWNDFWKARIDAVSPRRQENSQKYVYYIVEMRRRAGLPELHNYQQGGEQ